MRYGKTIQKKKNIMKTSLPSNEIGKPWKIPSRCLKLLGRMSACTVISINVFYPIFKARSPHIVSLFNIIAEINSRSLFFNFSLILNKWYNGEKIFLRGISTVFFETDFNAMKKKKKKFLKFKKNDRKIIEGFHIKHSGY